jgi:hypothetical protein
MKEYVWYVPKFNLIFIDIKDGFEFNDKYGVYELRYKYTDFIPFEAYLVGEL